MVFVNQVISRSERYQMSVVGWCRDGDRSGASDVGVTELIGKDLQFISHEVVVIPEDVIV